MKKATIATVKSFIRKNSDNLFINATSRFDGMVDGCTDRNDGFQKVSIGHDINQAHTFGVAGAWFVGSSRDYIQSFESDSHTGFTISNSCGRFILAIEKPKTATPEPYKILKFKGTKNDETKKVCGGLLRVEFIADCQTTFKMAVKAEPRERVAGSVVEFTIHAATNRGEAIAFFEKFYTITSN